MVSKLLQLSAVVLFVVSLFTLPHVLLAVGLACLAGSFLVE